MPLVRTVASHSSGVHPSRALSVASRGTTRTPSITDTTERSASEALMNTHVSDERWRCPGCKDDMKRKFRKFHLRVCWMIRCFVRREISHW